MNKIFGSIQAMHYTKYLERSGRISGTILIVIGAGILSWGTRKIAEYMHIKMTKYTIVSGSISDWEKRVHRVKLSTKTDYFPTLKFSFDGKDFSVKCQKAFGVDTMSAFDLASKEGRLEIRVPVGNPNGAFPNYEMNRSEKFYTGLRATLTGLAFIGFGVIFIVNRATV